MVEVRAFWSALRRWGERAVATGILTIDTSGAVIPRRARFY
jgi:hypothetical protein